MAALGTLLRIAAFPLSSAIVTAGTNLRRAALRGTVWSAVQQSGDRGIRMLVFLVLARLIAPESFGLVALAAVYIDFVQLFLSQGLPVAIVQRDELAPEHLDSAFWGNMAFGILLGGGSFAGAVVFAALLQERELASVVRWLSIGFLLNALSTVQESILRRKLYFRALAARAIISQAVAGALGVALAFAGFGVWSLVVMHLVRQAVGVVLLWRSSDWRPQFAFSYRHYRELFAFGVNIMGLQVLGVAWRRADSLLIGGVLGVTALGYYTIARQLVESVSGLIQGTVSPVVWSTLSRLQRNRARLERAIYQAVQMIAVVTWPAYLGIAAIAPELVPTLIGERWLPSVPIVQAFAGVAIVGSVNMCNFTAMTAIGQIRWRIRLEVLAALVTLVAIVLALPHGIVAVAWALAGSLFLLLPIQLWVAIRLLPIVLKAYLYRYVPAVAGSAVMLGAIIAVSTVIDGLLTRALDLAILVVVGVITYGGFLLFLAPATFRNALSNLQLAFKRTSTG